MVAQPPWLAWDRQLVVQQPFSVEGLAQVSLMLALVKFHDAHTSNVSGTTVLCKPCKVP